MHWVYNMRNVNCNVLSAADNQSTAGDQIDSNQLVSASFQAVFGDSQAAGAFFLQASNDICNDRYQAQNFVVTNWVNIPNQSANITGGSSAILTIANMTYRWIRAVYTSTATGVQTITTIADQSALAQILNIECVADVAGSLNDTYFLIYSAQNADTYYVWYNVDGGGTDPMIADAIGIEVAISADDSADDIAVASTGPIAAISSGVPFNANASTSHLLIYNLQTGPADAPTDGTPPTGFTLDISVVGQNVGSHLLNSEYFFINDAEADGGTEYYVWYDVDSGGTDPMIAGKTGIPVAISAGYSAGNVASATAAEISSGTNITAGAAGAIITATNNGVGPFTPAQDFNTTFAFAITAGGSSIINVNMNALGM